MKTIALRFRPALDQLKSRFRDESGAVTVDWVVLTAAIIGIGMLIMIPVFATADGAAATVANDLIAAVVSAAGL